MSIIKYRESLAPYALGRRVNMELWNAISRTAEGQIPFATPVIAGSGEHGCAAIDATTGRNVLGIAETNQALPHPGDLYEESDTVAICTEGVIGVLLGADVAKGAQARFDTVAKTWTGAAQSATVATIPGAQFEYAGVAGDVGVVRYVRPIPSLSVTGA